MSDLGSFAALFLMRWVAPVAATLGLAAFVLNLSFASWLLLTLAASILLAILWMAGTALHNLVWDRRDTARNRHDEENNA